MSIVDRIFSSIYMLRARSNYDRLLRYETSRLKRANIYKKYPLTDTAPKIWNSRYHRNIDNGWQDYYYCLSGKLSDSFIPPSIFYPVIEPVLNKRMMAKAIKDKNYYSQILCSSDMPATLLRKINGFYYDYKYSILKISDKYLVDILKPYNKVILKSTLDTGGGEGIMLFTRTGDKFSMDSTILSVDTIQSVGFDFILQEYIDQHDFFAALNHSSVNTVRVLTYRSVIDDSVNILCGMLKIGKAGCFLDHGNLGGVSIPVSVEGFTATHAHDAKGKKLDTFNDMKISNIGRVPNYTRIKNLAVSVAQHSYYVRLLGLDFTMTKDGQPLLLDINCWKNGINQFQFGHGTLFGDFTQEIIDYCNRTSFHNVITIKF